MRKFRFYCPSSSSSSWFKGFAVWTFPNKPQALGALSRKKFALFLKSIPRILQAFLLLGTARIDIYWTLPRSELSCWFELTTISNRFKFENSTLLLHVPFFSYFRTFAAIHPITLWYLQLKIILHLDRIVMHECKFVHECRFDEEGNSDGLKSVRKTDQKSIHQNSPPGCAL